MNYRLGKQPPRHDRRTLRLESYLTLPAVPDAVDWSGAVSSWPMYLNDQLGDCTCAAAGHMIQCWTANDEFMFTPADSDILSAYKAVSGYDPATPSTDQGCVELDVLNYWRKTGIAGRTIGAFASLRPQSLAHIRAAIYLFGGLYVGLDLPATAEGQDVWDWLSRGADSAPGSLGGHAVNLVGYDAEGLICITWGQAKRMTWHFWNAYADEAWCLLSPDWLGSDNRAPVGLDIAALQTDLKAVSQ